MSATTVKCPECGEKFENLKGAKSNHFLDHHPQYKFHREGNHNLICDVCNVNAGSFTRLVKNHKHLLTNVAPKPVLEKEIVQHQGSMKEFIEEFGREQPQFSYLRRIKDDLVQFFNRLDYLENREQELMAIDEKRTAQLIEAQKVLANLK
jgi:hypothetical protein